MISDWDKARAAFLGRFEPEFVPFFHQFCEAVSSLPSDVVMYTARKAVCLYESATELDLLHVQGVSTSDRVLDMDLEWLRGKSVTIVDDVVITGSSLHRAQQALQRAGCASVNVMALAIDKDDWVQDLVDPTPPYVRLSNRRAVGVCTQIVDAISVVPRPYNMDWPLLSGVSGLPDRRRSLNLSVGDWQTRNVTSVVQEHHGIHSITYTPSERVMRAVEARLGISRKVLTLSKVRAYFRPAPDSDSWSLRATPIIHFESLPNATIDTMFAASCGESPTAAAFITRSSRLRALQYMASMILGDLWCSEMRGVVLATAPEVDHDAARTVVSPPGMGLLRSGWVDPPGSGLTPFVNPPEPIQIQVSSRSLRNRDATQNELQEVLTDPFMDLYLTKELPARDLLQREGKQAFSNPEYQQILDRLSEGYSATQLDSLVSRVSDDSWGPLSLSTFLDVAIDHGMVVPITQEGADWVRRAFRHGEDIVFGLQEKKLFSIALRAAADVMPNRSIGRREVEKICVLFLKIGVQRQVLQPWFGRLGRANTAGIRWHLKGALVQTGAETLFGASLDRGLTDLLMKDGILARGKGGNFLVSRFDDRAPTSTMAEGTAEIVGALFGELLSGARPAQLSADEITLLASCDSLLSLVAALAAEVSIADHGWATLQFVLRGHKHREAGELDQRMRESDLFEAVNSGAWKYHSTISGRPKQVVDRIAAQLSGIYKTEWMMCWQNLIDAGDRGSPQLAKLAADLGRWLCSSLANLHLVRFFLAQLAGVQATRARRHLDSADEWAKRHAAERGVPTTELVRRVGRARKVAGEPLVDETEVLLDETLDELAELMRWAPSMLDQASILTQSLLKPPTIVHYTCALAFRFIGDASDREAFADTVNQIFLSAKRASFGRPYRLERAIEIAGCPADHVFVARGGRAEAALRRLGEEMLRGAPSGSRVTAYLLPTLNPTARVFSTDTGLAFKGSRFGDAVRTLMATTEGDFVSSLKVVTQGPMDEPVRQAVGARALQSGPERGHEFVIEEVNVSASASRTKRGAHIGVVTIISEETRAVVEWLKSCNDYDRWVAPEDGTIFHSAAVEIDGEPLTLALTQTVDQGQTSMVIACQQLQTEYGVAFNVLLGIGGSIHRDATLGDVVLAQDIVDYGPVALTPDGAKHRGSAFKPPAAVAKALNDHFAQGDDPRSFRASDLAAELGKPAFRLLRGPIGTGYAVVKFREDPVRNWLDSFNEKTLVLETEGEGIARYFYEMADKAGLAGYIALRVVSDHADEAKDDQWKLGACRNGVIALQSLLPPIAETLRRKRHLKRA
jgi:nucleoside phosphorylase